MFKIDEDNAVLSLQRSDVPDSHVAKLREALGTLAVTLGRHTGVVWRIQEYPRKQ